MQNALTCICDVCLQINFNTFAAVANAALGSDLSDFDPFNDDYSFLLACYIFEDVGVTAYHVRMRPPLRNRAAGFVWVRQPAGRVYHVNTWLRVAISRSDAPGHLLANL